MALSTNITIGTKTDTNRRSPAPVNKIGGTSGLVAYLAVACTAHEIVYVANTLTTGTGGTINVLDVTETTSVGVIVALAGIVNPANLKIIE